MGTEAIIRLDRLLHHRRVLRMDAYVHMLSPIAIRPAVEADVLDGRKIIRKQIGYDLVPLVDHSEQLLLSRLNGEVGRIARSRREKALCTREPIYFVDRCTPFFD